MTTLVRHDYTLIKLIKGKNKQRCIYMWNWNSSRIKKGLQKYL